MQCEFCQGPCYEAYDLTLGTATSRMWLCDSCGSAQISPTFSDDEVRKHYQNDYFKAAEWEVQKARCLAADYLSKINHYRGTAPWNGSSLEIGAGFGFFAEDFRNAHGIVMDIVEPSTCCQEMMRGRGWQGALFESMDRLPADKQYSEIFCFHVLEHLQRMGPFLKQVREHLLPGGRLWALTPNASSSTFAENGSLWGWSCPNQHYQFLSQTIPEAFFISHGFSVRVQQDVRPAPIHFPSRWQSRLYWQVVCLGPKIQEVQGLKLLSLKIWRRLLIFAARSLNQNISNWGPARAESLWSSATSRRPFDELLLVIQRLP